MSSNDETPKTSCCARPRSGGRASEGRASEGGASGPAPAPAAAAVAAAARTATASDSAREDRHEIEQCVVPAGRLLMGDSSGDGLRADGETPVHEVELGAFDIDATPVTNAAFARFVAATGYRTEAERFGSSAVFHLLVDAPTADIDGSLPGTPWWIGVRGADWRHPGGRASTLAGLEHHPVVHVTWNDAEAYCSWAGRRLPSEAEWEYAARGGLEGARHPWGDDPIDGSGGVWRANVWQGTFPVHNTAADGWIGTAPVRTYQPNGFGLWQAVGNVWEWCADWFDARTYGARAAQAHADTGGGSRPVFNPRGPERGRERVLRGGSYLCHPSYCNRYRNSARSSNTPDSSMQNAGFRTVAL